MNKLLLIIIIVIFIIMFNSNKKDDRRYLYFANIGKLTNSLIVNKMDRKNMAIYSQKKYIKKTKNYENYFTITTLTGYNEVNKINEKENLMHVFTDKPYREEKKIPVADGLMHIFKDDHLNLKVNKNHPNGIITINNVDGGSKSFSVTFTGCHPPVSSNYVKWLRGELKDFPMNHTYYNHINVKNKEKVTALHKKIRNNRKSLRIEDNVPEMVNKMALKNMYGDLFMDPIMRQCKLTFKFLSHDDEYAFEELMQNEFGSQTTVNLFIDSECPFWKASACIATKGAVVAATLEEMGPLEVAIAASKFAAKDLLKRFVRKFVPEKDVARIVNKIISCTPMTPLCLVGPIIDDLYGCTC